MKLIVTQWKTSNNVQIVTGKIVVGCSSVPACAALGPEEPRWVPATKFSVGVENGWESLPCETLAALMNELGLSLGKIKPLPVTHQEILDALDRSVRSATS